MEEKEPRDYLFVTPETTAFVRASPKFWENPKNVEMMNELIRRAYYDDERDTDQATRNA